MQPPRRRGRHAAVETTTRRIFARPAARATCLVIATVDFTTAVKMSHVEFDIVSKSSFRSTYVAKKVFLNVVQHLITFEIYARL
jgi:hypothetical protein